MIEQFILMRASTSISFSHIILWNFLSSLDMGGEALTMKAVDFLQALTDQSKYTINRLECAHPSINSPEEPTTADLCYKGINFQFEEPHPENLLMRKLNYDNKNSLFFSTPLFVSDLISVAELLRTLPLDQREGKLKEMISTLNEHLPTSQKTTKNKSLESIAYDHVYLPMMNYNGHKVLSICLDYSICLHSNEKAPFHILIEVENISDTKIETTLPREEEEFKRNSMFKEDGVKNNTSGSLNSNEEDNETISLKLSGETNVANTYDDSDNDADDTHIFQSADPYAGELLRKDGAGPQQLDHKLQAKASSVEESKRLSSAELEKQKLEADNESQRFEYQLARVAKKKPILLRKIF
mmetsp:Transcript_13007/g.14974  ORF Transcript_13007/g.14974 Transcript_13007/m.14974 type:complete len:355 (+) Transcript_13007:322-1386(+)